MVDVRRFYLVDLVLFIVVLAIAGGARGWYLAACCHQASDDGPFQVQDEWQSDRDTLVRNLKEGRGFVGRPPLGAAEEVTAHTSFVYPWLLSLLDRPVDDLALTYQRMRWLQCGLGALTAGLYFLIARRAFRSRLVALLAGLFTALHPFWVANTAEITDGVLATFLLAFSLCLGVRGGQIGGALTSILYGLALAALALVRAALLPFALVAVIWYLWRCRWLARGWLYAVLAFLGFVNGLIPWALRNYQAFHETVPVVDSMYLHLWVGNNPRSTGGPESEDVMRQALALERGEEGAADQLRQMPTHERYRELGREVLEEVRNHPADTIQRRFRSALAFLLGERWLETGELYRVSPSADELPDWLARSAATLFSGSLLAMILLGLLGWRWSYGWRLEAMPTSLAPVWIFLPYLLAHAESLSGPRLPLDGVLLLYAALVLACPTPPIRAILFRRTVIERDY
jgi:4-amino-4-deoxy-L-arabinose transferase-like glycosyltransferase